MNLSPIVDAIGGKFPATIAVLCIVILMSFFFIDYKSLFKSCSLSDHLREAYLKQNERSFHIAIKMIRNPLGYPESVTYGFKRFIKKLEPSQKVNLDDFLKRLQNELISLDAFEDDPKYKDKINYIFEKINTY